MKDKLQDFIQHFQNAYHSQANALQLGAAMFEGKIIKEVPIQIPLETMNRHGLIAGATGTGKTKTLQILAENLSNNGVPVLLMDIKGDLSGLLLPSPGHPKITARHKVIGIPFTPKSFPVELLSLSNEKGVRLRATVTEFGPILLSRILRLSPVQESVLSVIFDYCDHEQLPLLDLDDLKKVLDYASRTGKDSFEERYGRVSATSAGAILRQIVALEQQGAKQFFGEPSFDPKDLLNFEPEKPGTIHVLRLHDIQNKPQLFSTFMLSILAEIYTAFPEVGDTKKPELVIFIDEAHLVFKEGSEVLLDQIEQIVKLIRSKGIGLFFVTQNPTDIPDAVLSQLGLKIQHALRAFTAKDRKSIKQIAENFPTSKYYKIDQLLTSLGIGEALVTALDSKGKPTPLAATHLRAPMSSMDVPPSEALNGAFRSSRLAMKYKQTINRDSAYEILSRKILMANKINEKQTPESRSKSRGKRRKSSNPILKVLTSATFIRGVFGILNKLAKR